VIELHCHLDGLLNPLMLSKMNKRGIETKISMEALKSQVPVRSLEQWQGGYGALVEPYFQPPERQIACLELHIDELIRQGVTYAEIMVSRMLATPEGDQKVIERFRALHQIAGPALQAGLKLEFLVAIGRGVREKTERQAKPILALAREGLICGVAMAGDETASSIESIADILGSFRNAGLGIEIHAGETAGPQSVWDALIHGKPDRIGHAVRAFEDVRLVDELQRQDIHLEFCPTSNVCLGVTPDIRKHPILRARQLGMNFSVNTDDPGPFGCSMESERQLLEREFGFTHVDFEKIKSNAQRSSFGRT
jgi:adenosine deaminase